MPRPGVVIVNRESPPSRGFPTYTGTWFVTGITGRGVVGRASKVGSLQEFIRDFGDRVSYGILYDALDVYFREGGTTAYISRVVGPTSIASSVTLQDGATSPVLTVSAKGPGDYGNNLSVAVIAGSVAGNFVLVITESGVEVERSPDLVDKPAAIAWGVGAKTVNVVSGGSSALDPAVVAARPLTGGTDDRANILEADWTKALTAFTRTLGPGQVSAPGRTTAVAQGEVLNHCAANNRVALLDGPDTNVIATIQGARTALATNANLPYGAMFVPWVQVAGTVAGTQRTVPYCAVQAGLEARRDSVYSPNRPAAGRDFPLNYVLSLNYEFSDVDRETMLNDGINTAKVVFGQRETYGYRSVAKKDLVPAWWQFNHARLRMAISAKGEDIGENFVFDEIDGRLATLSEFSGALKGMLLDYWVQGSLYGETPEKAFLVNVGRSVNTPETIADGQLRAVASVRMSPHAELVYIEFVKVPVTEVL